MTINKDILDCTDKKWVVFTDCDLDGAGSYLVFSWLTNTKVEYVTTSVVKFKQEYQKWLSKNNPKDYDKIWFFDLDVSYDKEAQQMVDMGNSVIIDHHETHVRNKHLYNHATTFIKVETSCAKLIYDILKSSGKLTDTQKLLLLMVDDYDSYKLKVPNSYNLNVVFWNYQGDRIGKFVNDFDKGYAGFNSYHKNIIHLNNKKIHRLKSELEVYTARLPIGDNTYKFVSAFADSCINEIADYILDEYKGDVGMVVNLHTKKVSFRKNKDVKINLADLAIRVSDGGGHEYAAGGTINDKFMDFSKLFKPIK